MTLLATPNNIGLYVQVLCTTNMNLVGIIYQRHDENIYTEVTFV